MKTITLSTTDALPLPAWRRQRACVPVSSFGAMAKDKRPTVLHFAYSIGGGGAESMLMNLVETLDPDAIPQRRRRHQCQALAASGTSFARGRRRAA
jgi:hypothetical protein